LIVRWLVNALALFLTAAVVKGIRIDGLGAGALAALVLGIVNAVIRPVLLLLTLPINVVTLGLFTFVVNAVMLLLVAAVVKGFSVSGFGSALLGSVVLSVVSGLLSHLIRF
jgi:putative membrane protein